MAIINNQLDAMPKVARVVSDRNRIIDLVRDGLEKLREAQSLARERNSWLGLETKHIQYGDLGVIIAETTKRLDGCLWMYILNHCGLNALMDAQSIREARDAATKNPVPLSMEAIQDTCQRLRSDQGEIFARGVVNVFAALNRSKYRSNKPFSLGKKVICERIVSYCKFSGNFHWTDLDSVCDLYRVLLVLDGMRVTATVLHDELRNWLTGSSQERENPYFRLRWFQNGNTHIEFKRHDLVEWMNRLIAQHYGNTLGDARQAA